MEKTFRYRHVKVGDSYTSEHRLIVNRAIGYQLSLDHPIHHHDENGMNNANTNLVVCEDASYHKLLHMRTRVFRAGFDPNLYKWCARCPGHKLQAEFGPCKAKVDGLSTMCRKCDLERCAKIRAKRTPEMKAAMAERRRIRESDPTRRSTIAAYMKDYRTLRPREGH